MQTDERITQDASVINAPFSLKKSGVCLLYTSDAADE